MGKGLTFAIVYDGQGGNFGEGTTNGSELKKLNIAGELKTYVSSQCIKYDMRRILKETFLWDKDKECPFETPSSSEESNGDEEKAKKKSVVQWKLGAKLSEYAEMEFGYLKTKKSEKGKKGEKKEKEENKDEKENQQKSKSTAIIVTPAISCFSYKNDVDFGSNKGYADRVGKHSNIYMTDMHKSLYVYTVSIDLDEIGVDVNDNINLDNEVKCSHVLDIIETVKLLHRHIKGSEINYSPLFIIGGVYDVKSPFFLDRIKVTKDRYVDRYMINTKLLEAATELTFKDVCIKDSTYIGYPSDFWDNEDSFGNVTSNVVSVEKFFQNMKQSVKNYYGVKSLVTV